MKRFDKNSFFVLLASVGILGVALLWIWLQVTSSSDGTRIQYIGPVAAWTGEGVYVTPLNPELTSLQTGDIVVAIDGQPIRYWAQNLLRINVTRPAWKKGQTVLYTVLRDGQELQLKVTLGAYPLNALLRLQWVNFVSFFIMLAIGWLVFYQRPTVSAAQLLHLSTTAIVSSLIIWAVSEQIYDVINLWRFWFYHFAYLLGFLGFGLLLHFALIFPKQQAVISYSGFKILIYAGIPLSFIGCLLIARFLTNKALIWVSEISLIGDQFDLVFFILLVAGFLISYWNARSSPTAREQARWSLGGLIITNVLIILLNGLPKLFWGSPLFTRERTGLLILPFPLGIAVAIMRHHLFDIHILINRTLVYSTLTAIVVAIYVATVGWLGALFEAQGNIWISLIVTGLVAVIFQPLRERVQRIVNRLMYGERDDPYAVLTRLSQRLKRVMTPESILPTIVETVAQALKLPYAAILLKYGEDYQVAAEYKDTSIKTISLEDKQDQNGSMLVMSLVYQSETVGQFVLLPRTPGESFTRADIKLLEDIADQAGVAAYTVRMTSELKNSRERLVIAREEERRRLRRDLHDGLGSVLASFSFNLDAARNLLGRDPLATDSLLVELKAQTQVAIADIRRLIYDLRPAALDELGLIPALQQYVDRANKPASLSISLRAPESFPMLPAAVEVAAYRITMEALTNVIRHANAKNCTIFLTLQNPNSLALDIIDDGGGLSNSEQPGIGLSTMRERTEELGGSFQIDKDTLGGTHVSVRLPFSPDL